MPEHVIKVRASTEYVGLYDVRGFRSFTDGQPSMAGFSIVLAAPVAQALAGVKAVPAAPFWGDLEEIAQRSGPQLSHYDRAVFLHEDTALLTRIRLPWGDCCCLGVEGGMEQALRQGRNIKYSPHNVDGVLQASTILAIWLHWFNTAVYQTDFKLPFAM